MGAQMTKALGVYNEEEKVSTPQGPQRYRIINVDPRSATVGIVRTPIQVECTPTNPKNILQSKELRKITLTAKEEIENNKSTCSDNESKIEDNLENPSDYKEVSVLETDPVETEAKCYLETDIDKLDSGWSDAGRPVNPPEEKPFVELMDVRSPSIQISRTPIMVQCTPELFALQARIENMSFCDFDVHTDDTSAIVSDDEPSAIVSDDDQSAHCNKSSINNWLGDIENKASCNSPCNNSFNESPKTVAKKQKELNALKKNLFFTPDVKDTTKPKVRTPLGNLQASQLRGSPQQLIRSKQWKNIQEERHRRGIMDTENTPPNLPPLSKVSSAPGKFPGSKRTKTLWDDENTMNI